jgi:hypothetical protein
VSAVDTLVKLVEPLAEPAIEALVDLVKSMRASDSRDVVKARFERATALLAHKAAVSTAADVRRAELAKGSGV